MRTYMFLTSSDLNGFDIPELVIVKEKNEIAAIIKLCKEHP